MAREGGRRVYLNIWRNFLQSFRPRATKGNLVGKDHFGTAYYEIPADPQRGKRRPVRWFDTQDETKFDQELPPEWEAWLRGRRATPPTQQEIDANNAIAEMKKINARKLEEKAAPFREGRVTEALESAETKHPFPQHQEYELIPGHQNPNPNARTTLKDPQKKSHQSE